MPGPFSAVRLGAVRTTRVCPLLATSCGKARSGERHTEGHREARWVAHRPSIAIALAHSQRGGSAGAMGGWQPAGADSKSPGIRHSTCHRPHTPGCCTAQQVAITHMPSCMAPSQRAEGRASSGGAHQFAPRSPSSADQPGARAVRGHMPSLLERDIRPCSAFFGLFLAPRVPSLRGEQAVVVRPWQRRRSVRESSYRTSALSEPLPASHTYRPT